jgi:hypothetical protein
MWADLHTKALLQPKYFKCYTIIGLINFVVINPQVAITREGIFNDRND